MTRSLAQSPQAAAALALVTRLQTLLVGRLEALAAGQGSTDAFTPVEWLRDDGRHGGGLRFEIGETLIFNRASVNLSQVHYEDAPERPLGSATALSSIVHPRHPLAPSLHLHISWTELKAGKGYWRIMADLNPASDRPGLRESFSACLEAAAPAHYATAAAQGDKYFFIPALGRHRGVSHFYLEAFASGDAAADASLAEGVGEAAIAGYVDLLAASLTLKPAAEDFARQLAYHTLYFFQVLTLDRGTTSGLLVHDQNDIGILGSLPARIDPGLLASWREQLPTAQQALLDALLAVLPADGAVDTAIKPQLAAAVRAHYRAFPEALALQARGDVVPPTVDNHAPGS